jgi:hypothetical protein
MNGDFARRRNKFHFGEHGHRKPARTQLRIRENFSIDGLILDGNKLIGIAICGGNGSPAGYNNSGGTLYQLTLNRF